MEAENASKIVKRWGRSPELVLVFDWWLWRNIFLIFLKNFQNSKTAQNKRENYLSISAGHLGRPTEPTQDQHASRIPAEYSAFCLEMAGPQGVKNVGKVSLSVLYESEEV